MQQTFQTGFEETEELSPQLCAYFIDVGQGDSILLTTPDKMMLIDGGDHPFYGRKVYGKFTGQIIRDVIDRIGRDVIDLNVILLTHPDSDHYGGLLQLVGDKGFKKLKVDFRNITYYDANQIVEKERIEKEEYRSLDFWKQLQKDGSVTEVARLDPIRLYTNLTQFEITVLWPTKPHTFQEKDHLKKFQTFFTEEESLELKKEGFDINRVGTVWNANSVILRIVFKQFSMLLMADAEPDTEMKLLELQNESDKTKLKSTVTKASHHGSKFASLPQFVKEASPIVAIFSANKEQPPNDYGHPTNWAINNYNETKAETYRTDHDGTIEICTEGSTFLLETDGGSGKERRPPQHRYFVPVGDSYTKLDFFVFPDNTKIVDHLKVVKQIEYENDTHKLLIKFDNSKDFSGVVVYEIPKHLIENLEVKGEKGVLEYDIIDAGTTGETSVVYVMYGNGNDDTIIESIRSVSNDGTSDIEGQSPENVIPDKFPGTIYGVLSIILGSATGAWIIITVRHYRGPFAIADRRFQGALALIQVMVSLGITFGAILITVGASFIITFGTLIAESTLIPKESLGDLTTDGLYYIGAGAIVLGSTLFSSFKYVVRIAIM